MVSAPPAEGLLLDVQPAGFSVDLAFFGQFVQGVAQLPGIELCSLLQLGDGRAVFTSLDGTVYGIQHRFALRTTGFLCRRFAGRCWLAFGCCSFGGFLFIYLLGNPLYLFGEGDQRF